MALLKEDKIEVIRDEEIGHRPVKLRV